MNEKHGKLGAATSGPAGQKLKERGSLFNFVSTGHKVFAAKRVAN
jgi:hypothetical protein